MKIIIFSLLLVLCFQLCSTTCNCKCSSCEADLAELSKNAVAFLKKGISKADEGLKNLSGTFASCSKLFEIERSFSTFAYATNSTVAQANLDSFLQKFPCDADNFQKEFNRLECINNEILQAADNFSQENDLRYQFLTLGGGRESQLNTLKREISTLIRGIRTNTADIGTSIKNAGRALAGLRQIVKEIAVVNNTTRNKCEKKGDFCKKKQDINELFIKFHEIHWPGHLQAIVVQERLQKMLYTFSPLIVKYDCAM